MMKYKDSNHKEQKKLGDFSLKAKKGSSLIKEKIDITLD